jgi:hypothetical protein
MCAEDDSCHGEPRPGSPAVGVIGVAKRPLPYTADTETGGGRLQVGESGDPQLPPTE